MKIISQSFKDGEAIPVDYTCAKGDKSPQISWTSIPKGTVSFALTCEDIDAPNGVFTHWIVYNMLPVTTRLLEDQPKINYLPNSGIQGTNDFGNFGWGGPCPPTGKAHRYVFTVYSLDIKLRIDKNPVTRQMFDEAIKDHIISSAKVTGTFEQKKSNK
ncbi:MAG: YbhB/YbcL family Raf kinase inhibitor-like protein [Caldisericia bacterium]|nr:YbhB/YbcL family Raf kinase inhibitor-like protein [Caldisericia bacterium]